MTKNWPFKIAGDHILALNKWVPAQFRGSAVTMQAALDSAWGPLPSPLHATGVEQDNFDSVNVPPAHVASHEMWLLHKPPCHSLILGWLGTCDSTYCVRLST